MEDRIERLDLNNYGLVWSFQVNPSSCENPDYFSEYLRFVALSDRKQGNGTTHLFIRKDEQGERILGFVTLRASSYIREHPDATLGDPALEIYELAVSKDAEGSGIGRALIMFAVAEALRLRTESIGIRYLLLCATEQAVPFYERMLFGKVANYVEVPRDMTNRNCIPMFLKLEEER